MKDARVPRSLNFNQVRAKIKRIVILKIDPITEQCEIL